jgi:magnesium chelatase subunit D
LQALRAARAAAALEGRCEVNEEDIRLATRLIMVPRATQVPPSPEQEQPEEQEEEQQQQPTEQPPEEPPPEPETEPEEGEDSGDDDEQTQLDGIPQELVLEAARAALPDDLFERLKIKELAQRSQSAAGQAGALQQGGSRGRPAGIRRESPRSGKRLNVVETLRAAAPWQTLRRSQQHSERKVIVQPDDFRVTRYKQRTQTTTIFAVDASGSAAMNRLAEAKGAVELLLAECYVRRDEVALISFRGTGAEELLPPTRSLTRAKRSLAGLPGGGGTPLAAGLDAARDLIEEVQRKGNTPVLIVLTDGRANITRAGVGGREQAQKDANEAAQAVRLTGVRALVVDTSPRPRPLSRELAESMGCDYLPLPRADASSISEAVQAVTAAKG